MGGACCGGSLTPEEYLREVFSTKCLITLTKQDIDNLLFKHIHGGNDLKNKSNLKIDNETYLEIVDDIIHLKYLKSQKDKYREALGKDFKDQNVVKNFLEGIFPLFNFNETTNCLIFKLLMCPFTLKDTMLVEEREKILFECIKCVNYSNKEVNLLEKDMTYNRFCETFSVYLAIILSGFTKVLKESLNEKDTEQNFLKDGFVENLKNWFNPENIKNYYMKIINDLVKQIENSKDFNSLDNSMVTFELFKDLCEKNPQIIDYFKLRDDFIQFSINKRNDQFLMS